MFRDLVSIPWLFVVGCRKDEDARQRRLIVSWLQIGTKQRVYNVFWAIVWPSRSA